MQARRRALLELALAYYSKKAAARQGRAASPRRPLPLARLYSEVRRDGQAASKHWQACSQALREVLRLCVSRPPRRSARHPAELKRIAEFVNRKLTRCASPLCGRRGDAFRRHVRLFRPLVTHPRWALPGWRPARGARCPRGRRPHPLGLAV